MRRLTLVTAFCDGVILNNTSVVFPARVSGNKAITRRALVGLIGSISYAHPSGDWLGSDRYTSISLTNIVVITGSGYESRRGRESRNRLTTRSRCPCRGNVLSVIRDP
jgi:hypothetical protein